MKARIGRLTVMNDSGQFFTCTLTPCMVGCQHSCPLTSQCQDDGLKPWENTEHCHYKWWQVWQPSTRHQGLETALRHVHRGPCSQLLRLVFVMVNIQKITMCDGIPTSG